MTGRTTPKRRAPVRAGGKSASVQTALGVMSRPFWIILMIVGLGVLVVLPQPLGTIVSGFIWVGLVLLALRAPLPSFLSFLTRSTQAGASAPMEPSPRYPRGKRAASKGEDEGRGWPTWKRDVVVFVVVVTLMSWWIITATRDETCPEGQSVVASYEVYRPQHTEVICGSGDRTYP